MTLGRRNTEDIAALDSYLGSSDLVLDLIQVCLLNVNMGHQTRGSETSGAFDAPFVSGYFLIKQSS